MDKVDVWIQLDGMEPQPRRVARRAGVLAWSALRNVPAERVGSFEVDPLGLFQPRRGSRRRDFLPADVLVHVDYTVIGGIELAAVAAPWMRLTELWPELSVVLLRVGEAGHQAAELRGGLAVAVATDQKAGSCAACVARPLSGPGSAEAAP